MKRPIEKYLPFSNSSSLGISSSSYSDSLSLLSFSLILDDEPPNHFLKPNIKIILFYLIRLIKNKIILILNKYYIIRLGSFKFNPILRKFLIN